MNFERGTSPEDVLIRMDSYLDEWRSSGDPRHTFLACYRTMTGNMLHAIEEGFFEDRDWVRRLLHHFANYYFHALTCYDKDDVIDSKAHKATKLFYNSFNAWWRLQFQHDMAPLRTKIRIVSELSGNLYD